MSGTRRLLSAVTVAAMLSVAGVASAVEGLLLPTAGDDDAVLTLLLLGSDEGPPRGPDPQEGRADAFHLLFVSGDRQHATFVSVPRDAWVPVPGQGTTKINACLVDGPQRCVETVEAEFDVDVDGYLLTSMEAFKHAGAEFGGLHVDVPQPLTDGGTAIPEAGPQKLTGSQLLTYARDRKSRSGGDFERSAAQAELLALGHEAVVDGGDLVAVVHAVSVLRRHTITDLNGPRLARLGFEALRLPPSQVEREVAPGVLDRVGEAYVVRLQPGAYELVHDAREDGRLG